MKTMKYVPLVEKLKKFTARSEPVDDKKLRLGVERNQGLETEKGLQSDFYMKTLGPFLNKEREKAILQISQPKPGSSMERLSAKLELIEAIRSSIATVIERGRKAEYELEEIRKKENG